MEHLNEKDYKLYLVTRDPLDPSYEEPSTPSEAAHYIVQFVKPLTFEEQNRLRATYGLSLTDYVPNFAFLEWLEPQAWEALTNDNLYRASMRYEERDKISPYIEASPDVRTPLMRAVLFPNFSDEEYQNVVESIKGLSARSVSANAHEGSDYETGDVRTKKPRSKTVPRVQGSAGHEADADKIKILDDRALGGDVQVVFAPMSRELLLELARLKEVRWIEEVPEVNLDAAVLTEGTPAGLIQSGTVGSTPLWNRGIQGQGEVIGVTDTTVNLNHCMFRDPSGAPIGPAHRKVVGNRQTSALSVPHGHRVAALAAGFDSNGSSINNNKGMAFMAKLSLDGKEHMELPSHSFFSILTSQANDMAFVHSNSWHQGSVYDELAVEVDRFVWNNEEHLVCGSSGNWNEHMGPPGIAKNALCVSASKNSNHMLDVGDGVTGPPTGGDLRLKPEICAPGCNLFTAHRDHCGTTHLNCASSWATPIIAGAAALVRQYYLEGWYLTGTKRPDDSLRPSGALVKATLLNSTVDMNPDGYPSNEEGWGLVRLTNTLFFADESAPKLFVRDIRNTNGLHTGESHAFNVAVKDDSIALKITLVWSDAPALPLARIKLVNNLDLIVTAPDGKKFFGNNLDDAGISTEDVKTDTLNNVEMVIRNENLQGVWTIEVSCAAANGDTKTQGYALVVTAALV